MNEAEQKLFNAILKLLKKHKASLELDVAPTIAIYRDNKIIAASKSLEIPLDLADGDVLRAVVKSANWSVKIPQIEETTK